MGRITSPSGLVAALQSSLSAGVFALFFFAQLFAYLLYLYPRSEWLWFLSPLLNREARPLLDLFDAVLPAHPVYSCAVLASICLIPLVFLYRKNWLGMSVSGHLALIFALVPLAIAIQNGGGSSASASLSDMVDFASGHIATSFWLLVVSGLLPLCLLNHVTFFREVRRQASV